MGRAKAGPPSGSWHTQWPGPRPNRASFAHLCLCPKRREAEASRPIPPASSHGPAFKAPLPGLALPSAAGRAPQGAAVTHSAPPASWPDPGLRAHTSMITHAHTHARTRGQTGSTRLARGLWRTSLPGGCPLPSLPPASASHLPDGQQCPVEASRGWARGGASWVQGVGSREKTDPGWWGPSKPPPPPPCSGVAGRGHRGAASTRPSPTRGLQLREWVHRQCPRAPCHHTRPRHLALGMDPESPVG